MLKIKIYVFLFFTLSNLYAANLVETKHKLLDLNSKIINLQHKLQNAHNKTAILLAELAETEKKIDLDSKQLKQVEKTIKITANNIIQLKRKIAKLNQVLKIQQALLAKHIRARYVMRNGTPLYWLLNQKQENKTKQLFVFYRYFIFSRQQMIENINITKNDLINNKKSLDAALLKSHLLQAELTHHKQKLYEEKAYNSAILASLNKEITDKRHTLENYQQNKKNLTRLIAILNQQSLQQRQMVSTYMHKKFAKPAPQSAYSKKISQGIVFFAKEGSPVLAIHPGKVVFSDWLNGYGLLLIVDHGRGFMSLYANNKVLLKRKGEIVGQGEQIATIGHTGGIKQNGLYFEIRQRGKAVSPIKWLA